MAETIAELLAERASDLGDGLLFEDRRWSWAEVVGVGPHVRTIQPGDAVLFNPEDRYEVEVQGEDYLILRERDIHAVAAPRLDEDGSTGLYL